MNGDSTEGIVEVIVGKNRNGKMGKVKLLFSPETCRMGDLSGGGEGETEEDIDWD